MATCSEAIPTASRAGEITRATVGSATAPSTSEVTVIPSWAPDSSKERSRRREARRTARGSPSAAWASTRLRLTATSANSPATKKPLRATRTRTTVRPSQGSIQLPPWGEARITRLRPQAVAARVAFLLSASTKAWAEPSTTSVSTARPENVWSPTRTTTFTSAMASAPEVTGTTR